MIVYRLTCLATRLCYYGSTVADLRVRWKQHWKSGKTGHGEELYVAMRAHPSPHDWKREVVSTHVSVRSMIEAEAALVKLNLRPAGYNVELVDVEREVALRESVVAANAKKRDFYVENGRKGCVDLEVARELGLKGARFGCMGAAQPTRDEMTDEQLEEARQHGLRGAAARTREERVAAGKKGAMATWSKPPGELEAMKAKQRQRRSAWWDGLTEEQKEAIREAGRQGGKKGAKG